MDFTYVSVSENSYFQIDGNGGGLISCGIIARSAGLFENSAKKFCACDGVPIWDERDREDR